MFRIWLTRLSTKWIKSKAKRLEKKQNLQISKKKLTDPSGLQTTSVLSRDMACIFKAFNPDKNLSLASFRDGEWRIIIALKIFTANALGARRLVIVP